MNIIYGLILTVEILLLGVCALKAAKITGKIARIVFAFEVLSFFTGIMFVIYIFSTDIIVMTVLKGIVLACFDWLVILMMDFTQNYTETFKGIKIIKLIMVAYSVIDSVLLITNVWTQWVFNITKVKGDIISSQYAESGFIFKFHYLYNYIFISFILIAYVVKIIKSSRFYRFRYAVIFCSILIAFILDFITVRINSVYDISVASFGIMAIFIYYFSLKYVPNELIENTLSLIIKDMNSGIICFDNSGRCIYCNELVKSIYKVTDKFSELEDSYNEWINKTADSRKDTMEFEVPIENNDQRKIYEIIYKRIYDDKENFVCDYFMINDRTKEIESFEREKYKASHDSLTGLLNREQFYIDTYECIHKNKDTKYCMVCSNIKDFKFINELFGLKKGNEVLKKQADLIKNYIKEDSLTARLQSDRFAMCMPVDRFKEEFILSSIEEMQKEFANSSFRLHVFVGVYYIEDLEEPVNIMCDKASIARDTIKNDYQSCIAYYNEDLLERSIEERRIIGEFERALVNEEFVMFLQPQVDNSGYAHGAEALVRWQHPERGLLSPAVFIDVLEKAGLIYKLDRYMWEKAADKLSRWKGTPMERYHISVNISTKDFYLIDVYETFTGLVEKYDIKPEKLKLEITETALMSDLEKNMEIIRRLQKYGFLIEIDDFGSGYSSLNMLKDISADILKIDMGFLRETENEIKGRDILESIITLAGKLGMEVITEGVETSAQLSMLTEMGCNLFQGYYFSRPVPVEEFERKYHLS